MVELMKGNPSKNERKLKEKLAEQVTLSLDDPKQHFS
jgi:hypothetical protein